VKEPVATSVAGAVYNPLVEIAPTVAFPPATPFTAHVTAVFVDPVTVAVNCCVFPSDTIADAGDRLTLTGTGTVTVAWADFVTSAALVAATVKEPVAASVAGAVYNPLVEIVPTVAFPPATPFTVHATAVFADPATVAVNCCVFPKLTVADAGDGLTLTLTGTGTVTVACADLVASATLVATIAKEPVAASVAGAV
jgi:hypothetical protein